MKGLRMRVSALSRLWDASLRLRRPIVADDPCDARLGRASVGQAVGLRLFEDDRLVGFDLDVRIAPCIRPQAHLFGEQAEEDLRIGIGVPHLR